MSYNPWIEAATALTGEQARSFYAETIKSHTENLVISFAVAGCAAFVAGYALRNVHDKHIVPATQKAWAAMRNKTTKPLELDKAESVTPDKPVIAPLPAVELQPSSEQICLRVRAEEDSFDLMPPPDHSSRPECIEPNYRTLQQLCKERGLPARGTTAELTQRLTM
jgi:hypothetical protein